MILMKWCAWFRGKNDEKKNRMRKQISWNEFCGNTIDTYHSKAFFLFHWSFQLLFFVALRNCFDAFRRTLPLMMMVVVSIRAMALKSMTIETPRHSGRFWVFVLGWETCSFVICKSIRTTSSTKSPWNVSNGSEREREKWGHTFVMYLSKIWNQCTKFSFNSQLDLISMEIELGLELESRAKVHLQKDKLIAKSLFHHRTLRAQFNLVCFVYFHS